MLSLLRGIVCCLRFICLCVSHFAPLKPLSLYFYFLPLHSLSPLACSICIHHCYLLLSITCLFITCLSFCLSVCWSASFCVRVSSVCQYVCYSLHATLSISVRKMAFLFYYLYVCSIITRPSFGVSVSVSSCLCLTV